MIYSKCCEQSILPKWKQSQISQRTKINTLCNEEASCCCCCCCWQTCEKVSVWACSWMLPMEAECVLTLRHAEALSIFIKVIGLCKCGASPLSCCWNDDHASMEMHNGGFELGQHKVLKIALCENSGSNCVNCVEWENAVWDRANETGGTH